MAALSDPHTFLIPPSKHAEEMRDTNTVELDIKNGPDVNGKSANAKEASATKKGHKSKKREDRDDLLAALSDPRSYFEAQEKRTQQKKAMVTNDSGIKDGGSAESPEVAAEKSSKTKGEAEDDLLAALSDPRSYFAAQEKHNQQMKASKKLGAQSVGGAKTVKKQSKSKKETESVCVII